MFCSIPQFTLWALLGYISLNYVIYADFKRLLGIVRPDYVSVLINAYILRVMANGTRFDLEFNVTQDFFNSKAFI